MKRFKPSDATVHVSDTGTRLLVRWDAANADTYQYLRASFGTTFPRRGEATWRRDEGGWSVAYRYQKRLNNWIARTFEPAAVTWVQEARQSEAGNRVDDEVPRHETAVDLLAAYELLHLLPTAYCTCCPPRRRSLSQQPTAAPRGCITPTTAAMTRSWHASTPPSPVSVRIRHEHSGSHNSTVAISGRVKGLL
jgi:hypothetical protein